jgi:hypothetical protein
MINKIPFIGWFFSIAASISLSIPFYYIWNALAPTYFYQLPKVYLSIPFWHCVGLFIVVPIVRNTLTPKFVSVSQTNEK